MQEKHLKNLVLSAIVLVGIAAVIFEIGFYYYRYQQGGNPSLIFSLIIIVFLLLYCIKYFKKAQRIPISQLFMNWKVRVIKSLKKEWVVVSLTIFYFFLLVTEPEVPDDDFHILYLFVIMTFFTILDPDEE